MDAPDDRDTKLQRASGDLLREFRAKLPALLWKSKPENGRNARVPHRWAQHSKTTKLIGLLEPFQEWPQLLDPHLQTFLAPLVDAFLAYLTKHREQYFAGIGPLHNPATIYPLPRAICKIVYVFCKVRGVKVISRFLNSDPKCLELLASAFIEWDGIATDESMERPGRTNVKPLAWEERYVMLMWLSHLLLAPFDLASISSDNIHIPYDNLSVLESLPSRLPKIARCILSLSLHYIVGPGKEREAATALLARLVLRPDMQRLGLLHILNRFSFSFMEPQPVVEPPSIYGFIGILSFLSRLGTSGLVEDLAPLAISIFDQTLRIVQGDSKEFEYIRSSSLARKIIIKILRSMAVLVVSIDIREQVPFPDYKISSVLEDSIDYFLVSLADKDTQVRLSASKALSIVTLRLDPHMASEVIETVISSLDEDILYQKPDGTPVTGFEAQRPDMESLERNSSAVDPQRWQGLVLTLAHLLFRRAPPPHQLPEILRSLVLGLSFEQRSSTGSSVGTGVRDASCFGIWALSRKYTTIELQALDIQCIKSPSEKPISVVQSLAIELVCAACVDPSGNIRRGASAALQELIGRHPNTILEGISIVQVVDYHAVARRSRAMVDVSKGAAALGRIYWDALTSSLLSWRGIGSPDAESRKAAAIALGELSLQESHVTIRRVLQRLYEKLSSVLHNDIETRHGCLLAIATTVDACIRSLKGKNESQDLIEAEEVIAHVARFWEIFNSPYGPSKDELTLQAARPELGVEGWSRLISSLSQAAIWNAEISCKPEPTPPQSLLEKTLDILLLCVFRSEDISIEASSEAASNLFKLLPLHRQEVTIRRWLNNVHTSWKSATGRGQISALGAVFHRLPPGSAPRKLVEAELLRCTSEEEMIEKRILAVKCLRTGVLPHIGDLDNAMAENLIRFLNDYSTDRRGDIGSFIRIEAIQALQIILNKKPLTLQSKYKQNFVGCLSRLAAEKLDKVRFEAWQCLQNIWQSNSDFPPLDRRYEHFSQVSLPSYFLQLFKLVNVEWLRVPLIQGLATSAAVGSEGVVRASRSALIEYISMQNEEVQKITLGRFIEDLTIILERNLPDDRYAIPAIDMSSFLLDNYSRLAAVFETSLRKLFVLVQKAHYKSSNLQRLEAVIKLYASLTRILPLKTDVIKKLISMLLHPYPKIRLSVADYLFIETASEILKMEDWSSPPKELKIVIERLRKELGLTTV